MEAIAILVYEVDKTDTNNQAKIENRQYFHKIKTHESAFAYNIFLVALTPDDSECPQNS